MISHVRHRNPPCGARQKQGATVDELIKAINRRGVEVLGKESLWTGPAMAIARAFARESAEKHVVVHTAKLYY